LNAESSRIRDHGSGFPHSRQCLIGITGFHVHPANAVLDDHDAKAALAGFQNRMLHVRVRGKPCHVQGARPQIFKAVVQRRTSKSPPPLDSCVRRDDGGRACCR